MNLDHYKDPRSFVQESVDFAKRDLQKLKVSDRIIAGVRFTIDNGAGYGCAVLPHDIELHKDAWLLLEVHAAGTAFLSGPDAGSEVVRFEFERVCQQVHNLHDTRSNLSNAQRARNRPRSTKVKSRNALWVCKNVSALEKC